MNREQFEKKLSQRKPNADFYKSMLEFYKGEFPLLYEEYFKEGSNQKSIKKFTEEHHGIDPVLFVVKAGFIDSAKGYHYVSSNEANLIDSE